jgi:hypothetical protein
LQLWKKFENKTDIANKNDGTFVKYLVPTNATNTQIVANVDQDILNNIGSYVVKIRIPDGPRSKAVSLTQSTPDSAPTGSISINSGASYTNSTSVTLSLSASDDVGVTGYYLSTSSTTPSASASGWTSVTSTTNYSSSVSYTLRSGDGTKTVYVWYKDSAGNVSSAYYDSIILDATSPTDGTLTATAGNAQVSFSWSGFSDATSGIASYKLMYSTSSTPSSCSVGTQICAGTTLSCTTTGLTNGTTYYYRICATDNAGNISTGATASATPRASDTIAPTGSISINSGATYTNSTSVTLSLSASDDVGVTGYYLSTSSTTPSASASGWTSVTSTTNYSSSVSYTLSSGDGTKTIYVWYKDSAGNVSSAYYDSIILDATSPTDGTLTATAGNAQVSFSWSGFSDATSGIASYKLVYSTGSMPSSCSSGTQLYSGSNTSYTHTGLTNGTTYYYRICATDNAGNISTGATASATPTPSCTYSISPTSQSFTSNGGSGSVSISTSSGCRWSASSSNSWITITSGSSGTGSGTVNYSVSSNSSTSSRTGTITIAGNTFTVYQSGALACSYTISPTSKSFSASGGSDTVSVTTGSICSWSAYSDVSWITITSGNSGTGSGTVYYSVSSNSSSSSRTGTITVYGAYSYTLTITQDGASTIQTERITNGSFSSGSSGWTLSGDFWAGTNLTRYYSSPGYAAGGVDSTGSHKNNASGYMYQTVTIPSNATSATLSFYLNITSDETTTTTQYDKLYVEVLNSSGSTLGTLSTYSNLDKGSACSSTCTYYQKSFSVISYKGQTIRIQFRATTDDTYNTVFRIDDVSLMSDGN